jgi:hypothetical protein
MALRIAAGAQILPEIHIGENPEEMDRRALTRDRIAFRGVPGRRLQIYLAASCRLSSTGA